MTAAERFRQGLLLTRKSAAGPREANRSTQGWRPSTGPAGEHTTDGTGDRELD